MKRWILLLTLAALCYSGHRYANTNTPQQPLMFNSFIKSLSSAFHGGQKSAPAPKQSYLTPQGKVTSSTGGLGQGLASQVNYMIPTVGYVSPISYSQSSANGNTYSGGGTGTGSYNGSYDTSSYGGSGGGSVTAQPDTSGLQDQARSLISAIQNAYHSLQGTITPVIQDKVNQYLHNYDTQAQDLSKSYGNTVGQTQNIFGARGLGDSSFQGNALDDASHTYTQNLDAINQSKTQNLGAIGQYAKGLVSNANAQADAYNQYLPNLGQYSASDLTSLTGQLQGALGNAQSQIGGLGTNQQFLDTLNQYAPNANNGSADLANKLQQLVTSSAPVFAKKQIAAGLVKSANLTDQNAQNYWTNYYQNLLNGSA